MGILVKDKFKGKFISEWAAARESYAQKFEDVDIANGVSTVLSVKDEDELVCMTMYWLIVSAMPN